MCLLIFALALAQGKKKVLKHLRVLWRGDKFLRFLLYEGTELPVSHPPGWWALQHQAASRALGTLQAEMNHRWNTRIMEPVIKVDCTVCRYRYAPFLQCETVLDCGLLSGLCQNYWCRRYPECKHDTNMPRVQNFPLILFSWKSIWLQKQILCNLIPLPLLELFFFRIIQLQWQ